VYYLTQQEMAALADTAREVVGRALKELEAAGAIEMRQGRAVVVSRERLPCSPQEIKGSTHFSGRGASVEDRVPAFQA
jgi:DNA-binding GntR family transcriptional regulator